ncbi:MAG: glutamine synthetase III [Candidatus Kapabacteria bacterium]|nr:glutamine synthetase III [Candidatus Kapabacteria bacterium]
MSMRSESLLKINAHKKDSKFLTNVKDKPISEYFGKLVFGPDKIKKYIMREAYESLMHSIETGEKIDDKTADFVAVGMRNWAMDNGATHFSHWFQPLTGKTAEKHDAFFKLDGNGNVIESFTGEELIKQETDGSSFPTGGLRGTSQARGYTIWDPSSYAFLMESSYGKTLCIPAIFISYTGESLDLKTPLLKSIYALDMAATDVCKYFNTNIKKVTPTLGWEQEYFIIDEALFNARPDLVLCGRTLFGNASARGQQLEDHYFASIPERVQDFMHDFEDDCLMMGIPIRTRHNEVAPTQFECAPIFETVNIAADHNQLLMEIIDKIAKRHGLRALMHEKPYAGINGSGKHNNWSLATDTGKNLLNPGANPENNLQFLTFFVNVIKSIHSHGDLLRASIATVGNEHRLGANEAPPAIISVYTGEFLAKILDDFKNGTKTENTNLGTLDINLNKIATITKDDTDRNRTSPFPFTGNRFEFRAVGSSVNVSNPMTVLNTMMADQLKQFKADVDELIETGVSIEGSITKVLQRYIVESENVIFNGNNYSEDWVQEAESRGLNNIKSTPEALEVFLRQESQDLFIENGVFTESELIARYNVSIEEYIKKIEIESLLIEEISNTQIIPNVVQFQNVLIGNVQNLMQIGMENEANVIRPTITRISNHLSNMMSNIGAMRIAREESHTLLKESDIAKAFNSQVKPYFDKIRKDADSLEMMVDDQHWPLPKYRELLFLN